MLSLTVGVSNFSAGVSNLTDGVSNLNDGVSSLNVGVSNLIAGTANVSFEFILDSSSEPLFARKLDSSVSDVISEFSVVSSVPDAFELSDESGKLLFSGCFLAIFGGQFVASEPSNKPANNALKKFLFALFRFAGSLCFEKVFRKIFGLLSN